MPSTDDYDAPPPQTLSIPSLILLAAVSIFAVRYFFFSPAASSSRTNNSSSSSSRTNRNARTVANPEHVETVAQMFPQISRRDIMWDLQRNGGSVAATTERVLRSGGLDAPPPTFQPIIPATQPSSTSTSAPNSSGPPTSSSSNRQAAPLPDHVNLIRRYNLSEKVASPSSSPASGDVDGQSQQSQQQQARKEKEGWSNSKVERQSLLQRRRDEMILNARRKMEERDRAAKAANGAAGTAS